MTEPDFYLEMDFFMDFYGTKEELQSLRDRLEDVIYESMPIHCGDPECCPEPQPDYFVGSSTGSSRIMTPEEADKKFEEEENK